MPIEVAIAQGGIRAVAAFLRRPPYINDVGLRIDAARGDPGMVIWLSNRTGSPLPVRGWGIVERKSLPRLMRLPHLLRLDDGRLSVNGLHAASVGSEHPTDRVIVPARDELLLRVPDAPHPSGEEPALVGWVELPGMGVAFSRPKDNAWSRSDIGSEVCDCEHHLVMHAAPRPIRLRPRSGRVTGQCIVEGCRCRRFRYRRALSYLDFPDAAGPLPLKVKYRR